MRRQRRSAKTAKYVSPLQEDEGALLRDRDSYEEQRPHKAQRQLNGAKSRWSRGEPEGTQMPKVTGSAEC